MLIDKDESFDTSLSSFYFSPRDNSIMIAEAMKQADNKYLVFVSVESSFHSRVEYENTHASRILLKEETKLKDKVVYNYIIVLDNCNGYVVFSTYESKIIASWKGVEKAKIRNNMSWIYNGQVLKRKANYRANLDTHRHYLLERYNLATKIRESIADKQKISAELLRLKYHVEHLGSKFELSLKDNYFIVNNISYYYSCRSLKKLNNIYAIAA